MSYSTHVSNESLQRQRVLHFARSTCRRWAWLLLAMLIQVGAAIPALAQSLLPGEFGNIDLGRPLVGAQRLPTIQELRQLVRQPQISPVLLIKLHGDGHNYYLPHWSPDGRRLAFQRSNISQQTSKLYLLSPLSQEVALPLDPGRADYDFAFDWAVHGTQAFTWARIESGSGGVAVLTSADGETFRTAATGGQRSTLPALYERTDGIWRLACDRDGQLAHLAYSEAAVVSAPLLLGPGTSSRWSRDGHRLLYIRGSGTGAGGSGSVVLRDLISEQTVELSPPGIVRSPVWSPDEKYVAYYQKPSATGGWQIQMVETTAGVAPRTLAEAALVNPDFESSRPAWEPSSRRIWYFSPNIRREAYYPLVAQDVGQSSQLTVNYPTQCTTPTDLELHPWCQVPELGFAAHDGLPQDIYVLWLNHY